MSACAAGKYAGPSHLLGLPTRSGTMTFDTLTMAVEYGSALASAAGRGSPAVRRCPQAGRTVPVAAAVNELSQGESSMIRDLAALIERMRGGQERALEELYEATVGKLYALAAAILRSAEDAEEIVCETYAYAWANAGRFDASRANALGWLLMLCRSRALDRLRQRRTSAPTVDVSVLDDMDGGSADQPYDILSLMQQRSRVYAALAALSPERRHLVSLAFLDGLSHQEIAASTRLPLGTVKSHLRRALTQLREALEAQ
jgi:RNA polymerase sigma factor (sigma-70 family)